MFTLKMPKLDLKVKSLLLHLKHLIQSDRYALGMSSIPPIDSIFSFERAYKALGFSITPSVHAIIKYVPEFIDNQAEKHDIT